MAEGPRISVVIPTTNRGTLTEAVKSALSQTYPALEVIVVFDSERVPADLALADERVRTLATGGGRGANIARQLGIEAAAGDAIALLDDDDYWFRGKLEAQAALLAAARADGVRSVVSAGVQLIDHTGAALEIVPRRMIAEDQTITDYLFRRRQLRAGEATMGSSSLMFDRQLGLEVPFDSRLPVHEDWDWLLRAARDGGARFLMAGGPQLAYRHPPPGAGLSRSSQWRHSVDWAERYRGFLSPREYGDLLLTVSVALAVDAGARLGALRIAGRALWRGRPGAPALIVAAGTLMLPRTTPHRLIRLRARLRHAWPRQLEPVR